MCPAMETNEQEEQETTMEGVEAAVEAVEEVEVTVEDEVQKWKDAAIRAAADLDNYRKRMARERADDLRYAGASLLEQLLPVFDNFTMGLQMAEKEKDSMIYMGMSMVKGQLDEFLASQGVKEVPCEGEFNPNLHEAVAEEVRDGVEPGLIVEVKRKGYQLHDRLLRAAVVIVSKAAEEKGEDA